MLALAKVIGMVWVRDFGKLHQGFALLEVVAGVALAGVLLSFAVLGGGNLQLKVQKQQLRLAAQRLIEDCRAIQNRNMFVPAQEQYAILILVGEKFYQIRYVTKDKIVQTVQLADIGCEGVYFGGNANDLLVFTSLGAVRDSAYIRLLHKDNSDLKIVLNLQPVTGRIEVSEDLSN